MADDLIEAIVKAVGYDLDGSQGRGHNVDARSIVDSALSAIEAKGYVVVPKVLTDTMRTEGSIALHDHKVQPMYHIWTAMIEAAPKVTP